jgi:hypothetical protein
MKSAITPPRFAMNLVSVLLRWLLILALLLPSAPATAETGRTPDKRGHTPSEAANESTLGQTVPPLTETPEPTPWPTATPTLETLPATPTALATEVLPTPEATPTAGPPLPPLPEALPIDWGLQIDQPVLRAGMTATVRVGLYARLAISASDLWLRVSLPAGLTSSSGASGVVSWLLPALAAGESHEQSLVVQLAPGASDQAVSAVTAELTASGHYPLQVGQTVGLAPSGALSESVQSTGGAVLQNRQGDFVLLAPAKAAPAGTTLRYTELYHWASATPTSTIPPAPSANQSALSHPSILLIPVLNAGQPAQAAAASPPTAVQSDNVAAYQIWELSAEENGEAVRLSDAVLLVLSVKALVEAGVEPAKLKLWTRASDDQPWQWVASQYDENEQVVRAWVNHFSAWTV